MSQRLSLHSFLAILLVCGPGLAKGAAPEFARLVPLPAPKIVSWAHEYPGGRYMPENLFDGDPKTAFASNGKGTETFVDFDFGKPIRIAAFRHVDRKDPAIVATSELVFSRSDEDHVTTVSVPHACRPGGTTTFALPQPVLAQRVRWRVAKLGGVHSTVGGAEIVFYTDGKPESVPREIGIKAEAIPVVARRPDGDVQTLKLSLDYPYAQPIDAVVHVGDFTPRASKLEFGERLYRSEIPAITADQPLRVAVEFEGRIVAQEVVTLKPARQTTVYMLPHSHTDIGYTQLQTEIEDKQINNLLKGIAYARETASNPIGSRFIWNVEVLWAADLYLHRLGEDQRRAFLNAVKKGQVELCGMYLNELTGLCRPEELMRLFRFATQLRQQTGVDIETAMISDVPGYTWGTVSAMSEAGIKYFSVAPNYFDRIGDILVQWENKPFYWVGPSNEDRVLVWIPYRGYATSHIIRAMSPEFVEQYQEYLDTSGYPYDIAYLRWAGHGDNAVPDPSICEFVKNWNANHAWPRFVISGAREAFRALETRYGDKLPTVRGDWTPYWEDGAGSSSAETAMNRASSDRLVQAEALWAIQSPGTYPVEAFQDAWRNVLLYSEHTWGAWCSVREPLRRETRQQWQIKRSYAWAADSESRQLLSDALALRQHAVDESKIDVFNTTSWCRSDLVIVSKHLSEDRDRATDEQGKPVASQRLRSGDLAILARDVPPFSARRFTLRNGPPFIDAAVTLGENELDNKLISVRLDKETGGIVELRKTGLDHNLVDTDSGSTLNEYLYLLGDDPADVKRNGRVQISVHEKGPLIGSLLVQSDAPGCFELQREVRLVAGLDHVELLNVVDKQRLTSSSYHAKEGKESVNFAFPFDVPNGQVRLHVPFGVMRPDVDQIPGACKNWFTVGRWADVSNARYGVTWVTLDAPLVQIGGLTATLLNSQSDPDVWLKQIGPTQQLYAWVMNNHWGTNYRAFQSGPVVFRFVLRPHMSLDPAEASRLAVGRSQPLIAAGARGEHAINLSRLTLDAPNVLVTSLKPSEDGKAIIIRLWEAAGRDTQVKLSWSEPVPRRLWLSDLGESTQKELDGPLTMPAWSVRSLRADLQL